MAYCEAHQFRAQKKIARTHWESSVYEQSILVVQFADFWNS